MLERDSRHIDSNYPVMVYICEHVTFNDYVVICIVMIPHHWQISKGCFLLTEEDEDVDGVVYSVVHMVRYQVYFNDDSFIIVIDGYMI